MWLENIEENTVIEYFVVHNSNAAPFFSDTDECYVRANSPNEAIDSFVKTYTHPFGLYTAFVYENADAYHKKEKPLVRWLCNRAKFLEGKTGSIRSLGEDGVEINGVTHSIDNPRLGKVYK